MSISKFKRSYQFWHSSSIQADDGAAGEGFVLQVYSAFLHTAAGQRLVGAVLVLCLRVIIIQGVVKKREITLSTCYCQSIDLATKLFCYLLLRSRYNKETYNVNVYALYIQSEILGMHFNHRCEKNVWYEKHLDDVECNGKTGSLLPFYLSNTRSLAYLAHNPRFYPFTHHKLLY